MYRKIDVPIFLEQPTDSSGNEQYPGKVYPTNKSIYGVRQAATIWGSTFHTTIISWVFRVSNFDVRIYFFKAGNSIIILAIMVEDMCFASNDPDLPEDFRRKLRSTFEVKLFRPLKHFIRWSVARDCNGIFVHQKPHMLKLLEKYGMKKANTVQTPLPYNAPESILPAYEHEGLLTGKEHQTYRSIVGGHLYLAVCTRPDTSFSIGALARQMHAPTARHFRLLKRCLRYIAGTTELGLHFATKSPLGPDSLEASCDSEWGGCHETRRSTTGYLVTINGAPVYWRSKRQTVLSLSSAEAEYVALSTCAKDLTWIRKLYHEICTQTPFCGSTHMPPTLIRIDSTAGMSVATKPTISARNKHRSLKLITFESCWRAIPSLWYMYRLDNSPPIA